MVKNSSQPLIDSFKLPTVNDVWVAMEICLHNFLKFCYMLCVHIECYSFMRETSMFTFHDSESKVCCQKRQLKAANGKASTNNSILRSEYLKIKYKKLLCKQLQNWFILKEVVEES